MLKVFLTSRLSNLKQIAFLAIFTFAFFAGLFATNQASHPKPVSAQITQTNLAICGKKLADYMNAVIKGAGGLTRIGITSPVFNLTNPLEFQIYGAMNTAAADWAGLDAFAGNTYRLQNNSPWFYYASNPDADWKGSFAGKPVIFTEFGNADEQNGPGNQNTTAMRDDFTEAAGDRTVLSAIYFNALNTNDGWSGFALNSGEMQEIIQGTPSKAGANSASGIMGTPNTFPVRMRQFPTDSRWAVEIINGIGDLETTKRAVESAYANGVVMVLRLCVQDSCGFKDPNVLINFLRQLEPTIQPGQFVYVVAGPNEPASESWLAPECTGVTPAEPPRPWVPVDVPCGQTYEDVQNENENREYHSLRPYPASPCDKEYRPEIQTFLCGHDLIAKQIFEVLPDTEGVTGCTTQADGSQLCSYRIDSGTNVKINLNDAELPIVGNTEDVPNAQTGQSNLSFVQRVNEYVSWYLNGVTYRAEEEDEFVDLGSQNLRQTNPSEYLKRINETINLSGPLKKLLPWEIQNWIQPNPDLAQYIPGHREQERRSTPQLPPDPPADRHNQVVVCLAGGSIFPVLCYRDPEGNWRRLTDIIPVPDTGGAINPPNQLFPFIPFSSTEDLIGRTAVDRRTVQPGENIGLEPGSAVARVSNVVFTSLGTTDPIGRAIHSLYYAHMDEDTELAKYLQNTYLPGGFIGLGTLPDTVADILYNSPYCEIVESRTNPGDKLYGDFPGPTTPTNPGEIPIEANVSYTAEFTCLFAPPTPPDPACISGCQSAGLPNCNEICPGGEIKECQKNALVAMNVQMYTPKADELWNRLVAGSRSVFKRMFPKVGPGTPVEEIEDIPGSSNVVYTAQTIANPEALSGTEAIAGDPGLSRPGSQAQLFFPHLGGIHEYFLKQIQKALRPYNLGTLPPTTSNLACQPLTSMTELEALLPSIDPTCTYDCSNYSMQPALKRIIEAAGSAYKVPASVLLGILYNEGGLNPNDDLSDAAVLAASGANCGVPGCETSNISSSGAKGPWQFLPGTWNANKNAVLDAGVDDGRVPSICNFVDATFAAARKLGRESAGSPSYPYNQCVGITLNRGAEGISTSCNWDNSRAVTAAKQYYGLCMDPDNDAAIAEFVRYGVGGDTPAEVVDWMSSIGCNSAPNNNSCYQKRVYNWFNCAAP